MAGRITSRGPSEGLDPPSADPSPHALIRYFRSGKDSVKDEV